MGLFDSVYVPCPKCGKRTEFQSKAGPCQMNVWTLNQAPGDVLFDVMNEPRHCESCNNWFVLIDPKHPPGPRLPPTLTPANVRPPSNPIAVQRMRFWPDERPFSYDDLVDPIPSP